MTKDHLEKADFFMNKWNSLFYKKGKS